jgi:hypothetical protein
MGSKEIGHEASDWIFGLRKSLIESPYDPSGSSVL